MNPKLSLAVVALGATVVCAGCTFPSKSTVYDRRSAGRSMTVDTGSVTDARDVTVSGRRTIVGTGGGAIVGGAAASGGSGVGGAVASAAGAVTGAIIGEATEEAVTREGAQELTIKMKNGDTIVVVQELKKEGRFSVGDSVQVLSGGGGTMVRRAL
jgi:outer membrane lipoprotein SlyB